MTIFIYLFVLGFLQEMSVNEDLFIIGLLFAVVFFNEVLRVVFPGKKQLIFYSLMSNVILIYVIGEYLVYEKNFFFFSIFILLLIDGTMILEKPLIIFYTGFLLFISNLRLSISLVDIRSIDGMGYTLFYIIICILIITVADFSKRQKFEKEVNRKLYNDLNKLHKEIEALIVVKERNRISRDIHDTLGHQWMATIMQLEIAESLIEGKPTEAKRLIGEVKETARESIKSVRGIVETLSESGELTLVQSLIAMILKFENRTGLKVQYKFKGDYEYKKVINDTIFRMVQESITNAVRHGHAENAWVEITFKKKIIVFEIRDNGIGSEVIDKGFGLKGMIERIEKIGGEISFSGDKGFYISGIISVKPEAIDD